MRHILASSLLLSSSLFIPAVASAKTPVDDAAAPTAQVRVSTGVINPKLLSGDLSIPVSISDAPLSGDPQVGLNFTVDQNGRPENIHVVKSFNPVWDARVVEAVSHFHYAPATIDDQPTSVDLNMTVNIAR